MLGIAGELPLDFVEALLIALERQSARASFSTSVMAAGVSGSHRQNQCWTVASNAAGASSGRTVLFGAAAVLEGVSAGFSFPFRGAWADRADALREWLVEEIVHAGLFAGNYGGRDSATAA